MKNEQLKPNFEFIALMASLMSIAALSIDAILPAVSQIGISLNTYDPMDHQMLITMIFLGLGTGQLFFGPLSDSFGRKPMVYLGFLIFILASLLCIYATTLTWMIVGRIIQGVGLSAGRTICISMVRDTYKGDYMAKVMSFVTAFFILVPVIAPALGKSVMHFSNWEGIFVVQLIFAVIVCFWFWKRQPETLKKEHVIPFKFVMFVNGTKELLRYKQTMAFTIISGLITGSFLVYLSTAQFVFETQYGLADEFPLIFAGLSITIGLSTFLNGALVIRMGMRKLAFNSLVLFTTVSVAYVVLFWNVPNPPIYMLLIFLSLQFFSLGFIFGNLRSIAMEPIGHIAGIGAAVTGFVSTLLSIPITVFVGSFVEATVLPLFVGLGICGLGSLFIFSLVKRKDKKKLAFK